MPKIPVKLKAEQKIQNVSNQRRFACQVCKRKFVHNYKLKLHVFLVHHGIKNHSCVMCNAKFFHSYTLNRHILSHIGEKYFWCDYDKCDKELSSLKAINNHKKQHKIPKPYKCDQCPNLFKRKGDLKVHKETHGEKSFECVLCLEMFATMRQLLIHITSHLNEKPHACFFCDEQYKHPFGLKRHLRKMHTQKEMSWLQNQKKKNIPQCVICLKTFTINKRLQQHIVSHLRERPYFFSICEVDFKRNAGLKKHLARAKCEKLKATSTKTFVTEANTTRSDHLTMPIGGSSDEGHFANENLQNLGDEDGTKDGRAAAGESEQQEHPEKESTPEIILVDVVKYCGVCREKFSGDKADKKYCMNIVANKHYI